MAEKPTNSQELIHYLIDHPFVHYSNNSAGIKNEWRQFEELKDGSIYWVNRQNEIRTTPINCGVANAKLLFGEKGFTVTAFYVKLRFDYLENGEKENEND
jgi:hypothetical protein